MKHFSKWFLAAALPAVCAGCSSYGGGSGGQLFGLTGGDAILLEPATSSGFAEVVVSAVAGAPGTRSTLTLSAAIANDNGSGVNWYVCTGTCLSPTLGGNTALGTISPTNTLAGGVATYTAPMAVPSQPPNNTVLILALQSGTNGAPAGTPAQLGVAVVANNNALPTAGAGTNGFVFRLRGFTASGFTFAMIGRFDMDGVGSASATTGIPSGLLDVNIAQPDGSSRVFTEVPFVGGYNMDSSSHGIMHLTVPNPPWAASPPTNAPPSTMTLTFTLSADAFFGKLIEADAGGSYAGSGAFQLQTSPPPVVAQPTGLSYVFTLGSPVGTGAAAVRQGKVGRLDVIGTTATTGTITSTSTSDDQSGAATQSLSGTYTVDDAINGHGAFNITAGLSSPVLSFYAIRPGLLFLLGTDANPAASTKGVLFGLANAVTVTGTGAPVTFDNTALNGANIFEGIGITQQIPPSVGGHSSAMVGKFSGSPGASATTGTLTGIVDINDGGAVPANGPLAFGMGAAFTIASNGRGTLSIPVNTGSGTVTYNFVFYMRTPGNAFFIEQPASDNSNRGRGGQWIGQGLAAPITAAELTGTFIGGTSADTATSIHSVGVFLVTGANGTFTGTGDASQAGFPPQVPVPGTASGTITITDQNNGRGALTATAGNIAGSAHAAFYVVFAGEVIAVSTDAAVTDPQVDFLDQ